MVQAVTTSATKCILTTGVAANSIPGLTNLAAISPSTRDMGAPIQSYTMGLLTRRRVASPLISTRLPVSRLCATFRDELLCDHAGSK